MAFPSLKGGNGILTAAGAHNGMSARLVEEAGFDAVWASGLEISASMGVPDADIIGQSESARAVESIRRATSLPVIVDCDAGYGNAMNAYFMAENYFGSGVFAVCIEDKSFPKMNSFVDASHDLVSIPTMQGKLRAISSRKVHPGQCVIARTETLIAGGSVQEALERCHAYDEGGADAILVHDKSRTGDDLLEFASRWTSDTPLVCVPTTYYQRTADELEAGGFSLVIYANHGIRSQISAVREVLSRIRAEGTSAGVEDAIVPVADVFALQRLSEFTASFERYVE